MLDVLCHFDVSVVLGALLDEVVMGRIALTCHFSLDLLCDKTISWPLPHAAPGYAKVISLAAENQPALMQYVMDGSTWSFICPFLNLYDTFNMRTAATTWNSAAKYFFGALLYFLLHNAPGHRVDEDVQVDSSIWWSPQRVASSSKHVTGWGISHDGGPGSMGGCVRNDCRHSCD